MRRTQSLTEHNITLIYVAQFCIRNTQVPTERKQLGCDHSKTHVQLQMQDMPDHLRKSQTCALSLNMSVLIIK